MTSDEFVAHVLKLGAYRVDTEYAEIFNMTTGNRVTQHENAKGYKVVTLSCEGKVKTLLLHRVVMIAHYGLEACQGLEGHHMDERTTDNSHYNLRPLSDEEHKRIHLEGL